MTGSQIIAKFRLYVDDDSNLSSQEELDLLNKIYRKVLGEHAWGFLTKEGADTTSTSVPYVAVESDFVYFANNYEDEELGYIPVVFVGTNHRPYKVIPFSQRRNYRDQDGYVYYDPVNNRMQFTKQPTVAEAIEYDYIHSPADLTLGTSPIFTRHNEILFHGMVVDHYSIEQTPKTETYYAENLSAYNECLEKLELENSKLYGGQHY